MRRELFGGRFFLRCERLGGRFFQRGLGVQQSVCGLSILGRQNDQRWSDTATDEDESEREAAGKSNEQLLGMEAAARLQYLMERPAKVAYRQLPPWAASSQHERWGSGTAQKRQGGTPVRRGRPLLAGNPFALLAAGGAEETEAAPPPAEPEEPQPVAGTAEEPGTCGRCGWLRLQSHKAALVATMEDDERQLAGACGRKHRTERQKLRQLLAQKGLFVRELEVDLHRHDGCFAQCTCGAVVEAGAT